MMIWFTLYANIVTSCLMCAMHVHTHGAHALCQISTFKYSSGLACIQADQNLAKIPASHFQILNTQMQTRKCQLHISMTT